MRSINHLNPIKYKEADATVKEVYHELKHETGGIYNTIPLHSLNPAILKGIWELFREVHLVNGALTRHQKEVIFACVSKANNCTYCLNNNIITLKGMKDFKTARAILSTSFEKITDTKVKKLAKWSYQSTNFSSKMFFLIPITRKEAPEAIGSIVLFQYLNRIANAFFHEDHTPDLIKSTIRNIKARKISPLLHQKLKSKVFLKETYNTQERKIPWALENEQINYVVSKFSYMINIVSNHYIPNDIKNFIKKEIKKWDGKEKININFRRLLSHIAGDKKILAEILYLQAFSSRSITNYHWSKFKEYFKNNDEAIITTLAWVSFEVSLFIGKQVYLDIKHNLKKQEPMYSMALS